MSVKPMKQKYRSNPVMDRDGKTVFSICKFVGSNIWPKPIKRLRNTILKLSEKAAPHMGVWFKEYLFQENYIHNIYIVIFRPVAEL